MLLLPLMMTCLGALVVLGLIAFAFAGPSPERAKSRRLKTLTNRHNGAIGAVTEAHLRRITQNRASRMDAAAMRYLPNPALLKKRLSMTGKTWTVGQYGTASIGLIVIVTGLLALRGLPLMLALPVGVIIGAGLPHMVVGFYIKRRIAQFTAKFPDAIELLVRGLRSGLPIGETMGVVGAEVDGPVGVEFRSITDKMKIAARWTWRFRKPPTGSARPNSSSSSSPLRSSAKPAAIWPKRSPIWRRCCACAAR